MFKFNPINPKGNFQKPNNSSISSETNVSRQIAPETSTANLFANGKVDIQRLTTDNILQLQGIIGNRAVTRLLKEKHQSVATQASKVLTSSPEPQPASTLSVNRLVLPSPANQIQRAPGLPTSTELRQQKIKSGHGRNTKWDQIEAALDYYRNKIDDDDYESQSNYLEVIKNLLTVWLSSHTKKDEKGIAKKKKEQTKADKASELLKTIDVLKLQITKPSSSVSTTTSKSSTTPIISTSLPKEKEKELIISEKDNVKVRSRPVIIPSKLPSPIKEKLEPKTPEIHPNQELLQELLSADDTYAPEKGRSYVGWGHDDTAHIGWKAHVGVGASPEEKLKMALTASKILRVQGVSHKFDTSAPEEKISKFLTIYPPKKEELWATLISDLELSISEFGEKVEVEGDKAVGKTGRVHMRHGQNTPLTPQMLEEEAQNNSEFDVKESGTYKGFPYYVGKSVDDKNGDLFLIYHKEQKAFFFMPKASKPYPAILFNGKVIGDPRTHWNPANASLPKNVQLNSDF